MALKGKREFRARLRSIGTAFKPVGREWAETTVRLAKPQTPQITGRTRRSMRVRNASMKRATVVGSFVARILDGGAKPHTITAKRAPALVFKARSGQTIFARKVHHRGVRAKGHVKRSAEEALRRTPLAKKIIDEWNKAA